ncbi:hypothetical protein G9272_18360 [Streptomyces asoensis]|uniref:Uncharacterized protein n=1 Tax=Streptomyces asoensis TaxID=249586 RepID=A0A6M4WNN4_9ACTN|nr:hypothetical protein [Streptomyces asoensis]QJT02034.1 hypothetical protein G9272_18360 [Streptomyces asoensis]
MASAQPKGVQSTKQRGVSQPHAEPEAGRTPTSGVQGQRTPTSGVQGQRTPTSGAQGQRTPTSSSGARESVEKRQPTQHSGPDAESRPDPGSSLGAARSRAADTPDPLMVVFLGQITNSQVAINNGAVTQTMTRELSEPRRASTDRTPPEPESDSPHGKRSLAFEPAWESALSDMVVLRHEPLMSAEERCRVQLLHALSGLLDRLDQLELSPEALFALRHDLRELRTALGRTPLDMPHVHAVIRRVQAQLPLTEAPEEAVSDES